MKSPATLFDKIWDSHVVAAGEDDRPSVLYIDLHLIHEVTSPQAFTELNARGLKVRRPDRTLATMDHSTPTVPFDRPGGWSDIDGAADKQLRALAVNCAEHGIELLGLRGEKRGIVHVIGPELGRTLPGSTIVCGDSHTSTHGAFGALAFGIGTTEVGHVLATQSLLQRRPKTMRVVVDGPVQPGVTAKDLILAIIAEVGVDGGRGHVIEYQGSAVQNLSMEGRMTLCNMSIEAGARAGMIAPDATTIEYLRGRPGLPAGAEFERLALEWYALGSDEGAVFDADVRIDATELAPMITWGTNPGMATAIDGRLPALEEGNRAAYEYMALEPGASVQGLPIDVVFVGSCTNGRIEDLRSAAQVIRGRQVAKGVRMLVVPGSYDVKREAEREGIHDVFRRAGAEWREPGCSMCIAMNGDRVAGGNYAASTSNRNFPGRQGPGSRTFLCSPLTAAATAVAGRLSDPRPLLHDKENR